MDETLGENQDQKKCMFKFFFFFKQTLPCLNLQILLLESRPFSSIGSVPVHSGALGTSRHADVSTEHTVAVGGYCGPSVVPTEVRSTLNPS